MSSYTPEKSKSEISNVKEIKTNPQEITNKVVWNAEARIKGPQENYNDVLQNLTAELNFYSQELDKTTWMKFDDYNKSNIW